MKNLRVRIASAVLTLMLLLTVTGVVSVRRSCAHLIAQTEAVMQAVEAGGKDAAAEPIEKLEAEWRRYSRRMHLFVPNQPLSELNTEILRLDALRQADCDELTATLAGITAHLQWIRGMELSVM